MVIINTVYIYTYPEYRIGTQLGRCGRYQVAERRQAAVARVRQRRAERALESLALASSATRTGFGVFRV